MTLSATRVRSLKPGEKPYKVADSGGLYVLVTPTGGRLWRLDYRFHGKRKTLALGQFPAVELADARSRRDDAKKLLANEKDPAFEVKQEKRRASDSFEHVAREWFASREHRWAESYSTRLLSRMEADLFPEIGHYPIHKVDPTLLLACLRKIESRGALEIAKRMRNVCGEVFRYAIAEGRCERDPSHDIRGAMRAAKAAKHHASLKAGDLPEFLVKLQQYDGEIARLAIEFTLHTMVRTNETLFASWPEIGGLDGSAPLWRIPAARMKMSKEHLVPLTPHVVSLLRKIRRLSNGDLLFPSEVRLGAMSQNTMLYALYRMGYHTRATIHGFRGTASTILNENGFNSDWIERQLAHIEKNEVRAAYNSAAYLPQRREMLTWWSNYLVSQGEIGALLD